MQTATETVPCRQKEIKLAPADVERFWKKVDKSGGPDACWLWTASKSTDGYGRFRAIKKLAAHRVAWTLTYGQIPYDGSHLSTCVCHDCPGGDNPACCNPSHLFLGSHSDNMVDKERKGRGNHPRGDNHIFRTHPECRPFGDRNGSRTHPERLRRGDNHVFRINPQLAARGEANGSAILTANRVIEIRDLYKKGEVTQLQVAKQFGVSRPTISEIINRKTWTHI